METPTVVVGMESLITALQSAVSATTIFGVVEDIIPFVGTMVPIALGVYFLRKLVRGAGHARVNF